MQSLQRSKNRKQKENNGSSSGQRIFPWSCYQSLWIRKLNGKIVFIQPDALPGDLIFVVQQKPHDVFERKGADLFMKKTIPLVDALIGF